MKYLIVQQWKSTKGNHAGYLHICRLLQEKFSNKYSLIELDPPVAIEHHTNNKILKKCLQQLDKVFIRYYYLHYLKQRCGDMLNVLREGDEVFLLEYNHITTPQYDFAVYLKEKFSNIRVYGMTHLTPSFLRQSHQSIRKLLQHNIPIDKNITLGSSLSDYFREIGIPEEKISTGLHAVDLGYYNKSEIVLSEKFTIIVIGAMQRNFSLISQIIKQVKDVHWIVCAGRNDVSSLFEGCGNVAIKGYMPEEELKQLMDISDFSLNVMDDTIGSNVITTSMAMGLGMFVSDVGSIRDYCNDQNAFFCANTVESFVNAINSVKDSKDKIYDMRVCSLKMSKKLSVDGTDRWFDSLG